MDSTLPRSDEASAAAQLGRLTARLQLSRLLFWAILVLGIAARLWAIRQLPPGLNQDEASIGVDAYSLFKYGEDRFGNSYPAHLVTWGEGTSSLYFYLLIPVIAAVGHLSPMVIRFPMILAGLLALPGAYLLGRLVWDRAYGRWCMFLLAISPWHILASRWALEGNILPFVFLIAMVCMLKTKRDVRWFWAACCLLGFALYSYPTSYVVVPLFLAFFLAINHRVKVIATRHVLVGMVGLALIATPIAVSVLVNLRGLETIQWGPITMPSLPARARYISMTLLGSGDVIRMAADNVRIASTLLWTETDGLAWNSVKHYGIIYRLGLAGTLGGVIVAGRWVKRRERAYEMGLILAWLAAAIPAAILQPTNINRFSIVWIPVILCTALSLRWLAGRTPVLLPVSVAALLAAFMGFTFEYHGAAYRKLASRVFYEGILPALRVAREATTGQICVGGGRAMYMYVLYSEAANGDDFDTLRPQILPFVLHQVDSLGRYTMGTRNCPGAAPIVYVLPKDETPPLPVKEYAKRHFVNYDVYVPGAGP
ncbi:MAG TPA: glycosyltransferase family 39 protein [Anaerolineales bacterium]|nr:glycosyltransferase family 39 protein [Anaerolineales bacterium]